MRSERPLWFARGGLAHFRLETAPSDQPLLLHSERKLIYCDVRRLTTWRFGGAGVIEDKDE